jgi:hypothetical protein
VWGGGLYWPTHGMPIDKDVAGCFDMDSTTALVNVEQLFWPHFEEKLLEENAESVTAIYPDGVTRLCQKRARAGMRAGVAWRVRQMQMARGMAVP